MSKYRDMLPQDLTEITAKYFYRLEKDEPVILSLQTPGPLWEVEGRQFWKDREAAEAYFQKLYEEESRKGNASDITIVTEI